MSEHTHEFMDGEHHGFHRHHHEEVPAHPCDAEGHEHHHHADGSCCCSRHEKEFHGLEPLMAARLAAAAALYLAAELLPWSEAAEAALLIGAMVIAGYDVLARAVTNLLGGKLFDEYFLMSFAAIAACVIGEFEEAAAVMLFYRVGETAQDYAIRHSRRTLAFMQDTDTGEPGEKLITRFSRIYTPAILIMALCTAVLVPLLDSGAGWSEGVYRALTFLVLACPCAIVISVPLGYFAGIGAASKRGVFFRDSAAVDELAKAGNGARLERTTLGGAEYLVWGGTAHSPAVAVRAGADEALARRIARKTRWIVLENIAFVIAVKLAVLVLGALGISALWFAVFADSGVAVIAVLNSLRAFAVGER